MGHFPNGHEAQKLRGRATLTLRYPLIESALHAADFDENDIQQAALWGNVLLRARDDWARQCRGGKRYSDGTAERHHNSHTRQNGGRR
jgi:hypothetical protein